jgi:RNA polymerase-binding transcription factor DksA
VLDSYREPSRPSDEHMNEQPGPEVLGPQMGYTLLDRVRGDLDDVEAGLRRLEDGTYGQCEACGGPIDKERLATWPANRYCAGHQPVTGVPPGSWAGAGDSEGGFPLDRVP